MWKVVCLDPTTGTNQSIETYWERIKAKFDERKIVDPYFKGIYMQRGAKAMANHWGLIQGACNKWHGIVEEVVSARVALAEWLFDGLDDDELQAFGAVSEKLVSRMSGRALSRLPEQ